MQQINDKTWIEVYDSRMRPSKPQTKELQQIIRCPAE